MQAPIPFRTESQIRSHSISAGNPTGVPQGVPRGQLTHNQPIKAGDTLVVADIAGPGMVRSFWFTFSNLVHGERGPNPERAPLVLRSYVIRIYWDDAEHPSVEAPLGDFFGLAHGRGAHFSSPYLGVSEGKGLNCFFPMPFRKRCRIEIVNDSPWDEPACFYQVNYTTGDQIADDDAYFHAWFTREITPKPGAPFVLLNTTGSAGVFVGMNTSALPRSKGTWREGDFRFYFDGEQEASIVGTGWSDWFGSAWGLGEHQSAYTGCLYQRRHPEFQDKHFCSSYRFFVMDPIYFRTGLRVEHDPTGYEGFQATKEQQPRLDDWVSTVYWYQHLTAKPMPAIPPRDERVRDIEYRDWE